MAFEILFSCISVPAVVVIKQHFYNTVTLWLLDWIQSKKLPVHYWIYLTSLGTALVALRNLGCFHQTRPVVGIGSQIAKVLGDAGVGRAALRGRHEIIFLDRSVEYLLKTMALLWELQIKPNTVVTAFFQLPITYPSAEEDLAPHEDAVPTAMTTRLRRQSERERELRELRMRKMPESIDLLPVVQSDPSVWTVDEVWAFIHSLPGMEGAMTCSLVGFNNEVPCFIAALWWGGAVVAAAVLAGDRLECDLFPLACSFSTNPMLIELVPLLLLHPSWWRLELFLPSVWLLSRGQ